MTPSEPTRAVYVRMPDKIAQKLDRAAERLGVSKRDLIATLVSDHLDIEGDEFVIRPQGRAAGGHRRGEHGAGERPADFWRKRPTTDTPGTGTRQAKADAPVSEVLTLAEAAELLRVPEDDVRALVESGEIPARRIGETWRLTRAAVLAWLGGESPAAGQPA
ncbi:helix-turn-helix domain-containing protein [Frankia sp. CNm7]|uniref:Helix-turn-helix domain-containing protein n=1 Tax=Frankia nepalensis TaxID=1836974 RepID=A0A937ULW4_9ACTN|nr:helix-turn-helix domain-containing protein [Frankia nepalensis]MBL7502221.1 helix-turn-helix domain-containing protein [Frankia nepalensis]MBL7513047.1 helix-turn-helix domain-containing protein [Frankia nepalensis]MBL7523814.1 helix-turn-helix domain-containing protein [Frankia nepalensis]MBL7628274.1 helix-turn-helix domain-containing protein [Frankia nepalensis]